MNKMMPSVRGDELALRRVLTVVDAYFGEYGRLMDDWGVLQQRVRQLGVPVIQGDALVSPTALIRQGSGAKQLLVPMQVRATLGGDLERVKRAKGYATALATGCTVLGGPERAFKAIEAGVTQYTIRHVPKMVGVAELVVPVPKGEISFAEVDAAVRTTTAEGAIKWYAHNAESQAYPIHAAAHLLARYAGPAAAA